MLLHESLRLCPEQTGPLRHPRLKPDDYKQIETIFDAEDEGRFHARVAQARRLRERNRLRRPQGPVLRRDNSPLLLPAV